MTASPNLAAALADRYRIERELGAGGMATVYLAHDLRHDRKVAVKVLRPELAAVIGTQRFLREIRTAASLHHPHILPLLESGEVNGTLFYVMPLAEGESLRDRLTREAQAPIEDALRIAHEVADALAYAHGKGVIHRDIKPENILLHDGHALVADFGIAAVIGGSDEDRLTATGIAIGTPAYMSPEQAAGEKVDARCDVYSLGCVLYEMLAGTPPFVGPSAQAVIARHLADPVPSVRTVRRAVPPALERVVLCALAKVPADRFPSAAAFGHALPTQLEPESATVPTRSLRSGPRHWRWSIATAGLIGAAGLVWALGPWRTSKSGPAPITSVAVQKFQSQGGDTAQMYLADVVTSQVTASLGQLSALRVISLRGQEATPRRLADNKIDVLLEGYLAREGNQVSITIELTSATTRQALRGGGTYRGDMANILNLQSHVAQAVADSIRVNMTARERSRLSEEQQAVNPVAFEAYSRGTYFVNRALTEVEYRKAIGFFDQAIALDSAYAAAYAGVAHCLADMGYHGMGLPQEFFTQARGYATRALALDSTIGDAHITLGEIAMYYDWTFALAEQEMRRGLALDPTDARGHFMYMALLVALHRSDEAIAEGQRAQDIEPFTLTFHAARARAYYNAGRYREAIAQSDSTLTIDSSFVRAHYWLSMAYQQVGRATDAIRELEFVGRLAPELTVYRGELGHAYAVGGQRARALAIAHELETLSRRRYVSSFDIATVYAGLGDQPQALRWLERAYQERVPYLVYLSVDPQFSDFRADPHFNDLLRRIGIPSSGAGQIT